MVDKRRDHNAPLRSVLSPTAMLLAILLVLGISGIADYLAVVLFATLLFLAVSWALAQRRVFSSGEAFPSAEYLDELAGNLRKMPPEMAFIASCRFHPNQPEFLCIAQSLAEGRSLSQSLREASLQFRNVTGILPIMADLLSFDANAAADGISRIADLQREKQRLRAELKEKLSVLSFRCTVLSLIGSASLAIIAFSFPLLGAAGTAGHSTIGDNLPSFRFDAPAFFSLLTVSLLSSCLSSKLVHGTSPLKPSLILASVYLSTYVILILTMGASL